MKDFHRNSSDLSPHEASSFRSGLDSIPEKWFVAGYAAALLIALLIIFRDFVFSDKMFLAYDVLQYGLWQRTLLRDFLVAYHTIPLWNPYILCGLPFVESIHGGIFYPLSFIDYLGYLPRMIGFNFLFHFWLAGIFAYFAGRQFKLSRLSAAVVGVAYAFSPLVLSWVGPGHEGKIYCATFFPLLLVFLDRVFERSGYFAGLMLGIVYGVIILTPHLQIAYYLAWYIAGYTIYKSIGMYRRKENVKAISGRVGKVAGAVVLALLLSAIQWLPSSKYIVSYSPRSVEERGVEFAGKFSNHLEELVSLAIPDFCGIDQLPYNRSYWGRNPFRDNSESAGAVTCFLALLAILFCGWRQKLWWIASTSVVIIYALGTTTPLFGPFVSVIPLLESMRAPSTGMFIAIFGIAMLAGLGVERILETIKEGKLPRGFGILLLVVPAVTLTLAVSVSVFGMRFITGYAKVLYPSLLEAKNSQWLDHAVQNLPFLQTGLWVAVACLAAVSALIFAVRKLQLQTQILTLFILLILISNGIFVQRCMNLGDPKPIFEANTVSSFLAANCGNYRALPLNISSNQVKIGFTSIPTEVGFHSRGLVWFYQLIGGSGCPYYKDARLFNLTGTKYIVGAPGGQAALAELGIPADTVNIIGQHTIYENKAVFPRVFLVDRYMVGPSLKAIQDEVLFGTTDLRHKAILEERGVLPILPANDSSANASISYYSPDSVEIAVQCRSPQLLILTDNWYPSWKAKVDGVESKIYRAYGSFRAVEIPANSRKVVFTYHSPIFELGKYLSILGLLIVFGAVGYGGWRRWGGK